MRAFAAVEGGDGSGTVPVSALKRRLRVSALPAVRSGRQRADEALRDFSAAWDCLRGGEVSVDDFLAYYADVGASVDSDTVFVEGVQRAWSTDSA